MLKRILAIATLLCALPMLANAATPWKLSTWAQSAGGTISSPNNAAQTSQNRLVVKTYTDSAPLSVTVTPNAGFMISRVIRNGVVQTLVDPAAVYTTTVQGPPNQSVFATFTKLKFALTAFADAGGTVSPAKLIVFPGVQSPVKTFIFRPLFGTGVDAITGTYLTNTTFQYLNATTGAVIPSLPAPPGVRVKVVITDVTGNATLIGVFAKQTTNAGPNQTVLTNTLVTLNGSVSTGFGPYAWTQESGPATVTLANANTDTATFTAVTVGTYVFRLTHGATSATTTVTVTSDVALAVRNQCVNCHATFGVGGGFLAGGVYANYLTSVHFDNSVVCFNCHVGANTGAHPGVEQCATCHTAFSMNPTKLVADCAACHGSFDPHSVVLATASPGPACQLCHAAGAHATPAETSCIACHNLAISHIGNVVKDNNGVRAITTEFTKWSHHVTGVNLQDAHCAACHLEGIASGGAIIPNPTYHMADAKTHLRNADDDSDMQWDPAAPNHSTMDTFCMSCHDANGATSTASAAIRALMIPAAGKIASASNPFGDTISNRYDKMQRPAVTNVNSQFNTTNNSHHAVKGPRYTGRTRSLAGPRTINSPPTFAINSSALLQGARSTIFDAGNLNQLYTPLENVGGEAAPRTGAQTLGDDSTLHCGDCHTVGQWKVGSSETANGSPTPAAIGAHGSNNEYLLRNSTGTDERHTQNAFLQGNISGTVLDPTTGLPIPNGVVVYTNPNAAFLVCYNCHNYNKYGSIFLATGVLGGHAGEYDAQGRCNGIGNTLPFNGYTTGTATNGTQFASRFMGPITKYGATPAFAPGFPLNGTAPVGEQNPDFGNIYGIQCLNCHNSGIGNAYGGIHGSANNTEWNNGTTVIAPNPLVTGGAYIDGMGNTTKHERFLPGLGDIMHVPGNLGGFTGGSVVTTYSGGPAYTYITGGISKDTNWEQRHWQQQAGTVINLTTGVVSGQASSGAGCYTLGATTVTGAAIIASDVSSGLEGPSVTGQGGPATEATDVWGGCDDHTAGQAKGNHGFLKKIVRPVTY